MNTTQAITYLAIHTVMALSWGNLLCIGYDPDHPLPLRIAALLIGGATATVQFCALASSLREHLQDKENN